MDTRVVAIIIAIILIIWIIKRDLDYTKNVKDKCSNCGQPDVLRDIKIEFISSEKDWKKNMIIKEKRNNST